jgi:hypothetical protein
MMHLLSESGGRPARRDSRSTQPAGIAPARHTNNFEISTDRHFNIHQEWDFATHFGK